MFWKGYKVNLVVVCQMTKARFVSDARMNHDPSFGVIRPTSYIHFTLEFDKLLKLADNRINIANSK